MVFFGYFKFVERLIVVVIKVCNLLVVNIKGLGW